MPCSGYELTILRKEVKRSSTSYFLTKKIRSTVADLLECERIGELY